MSNFKNIIIYDDKGQSQESNVNDLLATEKNKFKNWICWAGIQNITIDNQGNVYRAICRVGGILGNIYEGFDIPDDPIVCTKNDCTCAADIQLSKALPNKEKYLRVGRYDRKNKKESI